MKKLVFSIIMILATTVLISLTSVTPSAKAAEATVNLGSATPFAILSGTDGIINNPTSHVTGNVGSTTLASGIGISLSCAEVIGTIYVVEDFGTPCFSINPTLLTTARVDSGLAYTDADSRTTTATITNELGGRTLTPGVYESDDNTFQITANAGVLTLDGQGDSSSVFIFKSGIEGVALNAGANSEIRLINGAKACNIFWRIAGITRINDNAIFKGNVMTLFGIDAYAGSNTEGRFLAGYGVDMDNATVSVPTCTDSVEPTNPVVPSLPNTATAPANYFGIATIALFIVSFSGVLVLVRQKTNK